MQHLEKTPSEKAFAKKQKRHDIVIGGSVILVFLLLFFGIALNATDNSKDAPAVAPITHCISFDKVIRCDREDVALIKVKCHHMGLYLGNFYIVQNPNRYYGICDNVAPNQPKIGGK